MIYILNTLIVPIDFDKNPEVTIRLKRLTIDEARQLVASQPFVSAVGHEAFNSFLDSRFGEA